MTTKTYTCGVPLCGREATQRVHFYSDTPMLIRGMKATGEEGQHEFFCEQCYHQAGFGAESDITAIPVHDIEDDDEPEADPITEAQIWQAWHVDHDPDEGNWRAAFEHGQWWVTGWDSDDERHSYSVVEVSGPTGPLGFEEV